MNRESVIEVNNLYAEINGKVILQDISFRVFKGDITVILGSSGSGKTTLMKQMLGLYTGAAGTVSVMGQDPFSLEEEHERMFYSGIGVLYQNGALLNSLTIGENIALPLEQHTDLPHAIIEDMVRLKLRLVRLQGTYNLYPSELSGGMLKRAALARAIIMDPPLLFCDEPGAGLDPVTLASLDELIVNLKELLDISLVIITHEVSSILRIADRIVFIENGSKIFEGSLTEALGSDNEVITGFFNKGRGE